LNAYNSTANRSFSLEAFAIKHPGRSFPAPMQPPPALHHPRPVVPMMAVSGWVVGLTRKVPSLCPPFERSPSLPWIYLLSLFGCLFLLLCVGAPPPVRPSSLVRFFFAFFFSFKSEDALPCTASAAVAPADTADVTVPAALPSTSGLAAPLPNPLLAEVRDKPDSSSPPD